MQLVTPSPELAPYGLRAMTQVARGAEHGLGDAHRALISAAQRLVLHTDLDVDTLEPIEPAELAAQFADPALARQFVRGMLVMSLAVGPPTPRQSEQIRAFAAALGVEEPAVRALDHLANEELMRFRLDFYRRSNLADYLGTQYRTQGGLLGIAKALLGLRGLVEDAELAGRFHALADLPEGTLGHSLYDHYRENHFPFPGEPGGFPMGAVFHDLGHLLAGYDTSPEGELQIAAFQAGYRRTEDSFFTMLFAVLIHTAGVNMAPIEMPVLLGRIGQPGLADAMLHALQRGSAMTFDLGADWDFWPDLPLPVDEVRVRFGVPPLRSTDGSSPS